MFFSLVLQQKCVKSMYVHMHKETPYLQGSQKEAKWTDRGPEKLRGPSGGFRPFMNVTLGLSQVQTEVLFLLPP